MEGPPCKRRMCCNYGQRTTTYSWSDHVHIIEDLKLEIISILKSDQFETLSMHLTEMFVGKDMKVGIHVGMLVHSHSLHSDSPQIS